MTTRLITTTDGCQLATYVDNASARTSVLLSSSLGTDATMWWPQVDALVDAELGVVRYDARGHGRSEVWKQPLSIERLARDVLLSPVLRGYAVIAEDVAGDLPADRNERTRVLFGARREARRRPERPLDAR